MWKRKRRSRIERRPFFDLAYRIDEVLMLDREQRISGNSSLFFPTRAAARDDARILRENMTRVARAVATVAAHRQQPTDAFFVADARAVPQYRLVTPRRANTVVHVTSGGVFWSTDNTGRRGRRLDPIRAGDACFTSGLLWTSADPLWEWRTRDDQERIVRCHITVPPGTEVAIDRAPTRGLDSMHAVTADGREAPYPDVVLPPGEFRITRVTHYRPLGASEVDDGATTVLLEPAPGSRRVPEGSDPVTHARYLLRHSDHVVGVEMTAVRLERVA